MTTEESESAILSFLSTSPETIIDDTYPWAHSNNLDHKAVVGAIKSLLADQYIVVDNLETSFYAFTGEGESIVSNGSQEIAVLKALNDAGKLSIPDLQDKVGKDVAKIGMGNCMKSKWIKKDGSDLVPVKTTDEVEDTVQKQLQAMKDADFKIDALPEKVSSQERPFFVFYLCVCSICNILT
jgi:phenylalanyl-tRNA synthetase alpha chain